MTRWSLIAAAALGLASTLCFSSPSKAASCKSLPAALQIVPPCCKMTYFNGIPSGCSISMGPADILTNQIQQQGTQQSQTITTGIAPLVSSQANSILPGAGNGGNLIQSTTGIVNGGFAGGHLPTQTNNLLGPSNLNPTGYMAAATPANASLTAAQQTVNSNYTLPPNSTQTQKAAFLKKAEDECRARVIEAKSMALGSLARLSDSANESDALLGSMKASQSQIDDWRLNAQSRIELYKAQQAKGELLNEWLTLRASCELASYAHKQ